MKRLLIAAAFASLALLVGCGNNAKKSGEDAVQADSTAVVATPAPVEFNVADLPDEPVFDIVTSMGTIKVKLYSKTPKHRDNFVKLAHGHFYDGILFHRVINGFMIQAGDPYTRDTSKMDIWGQGGPGYTVPAEFVNEYYHKKGALAAARMGDMANPRKASSGSQFYLVQDEMACLQLDGEYTVYGETISGFDVIDRIAAVPVVPQYNRPVRDVKIITVKPDLKANKLEESVADSTAAAKKDSSAVK